MTQSAQTLTVPVCWVDLEMERIRLCGFRLSRQQPLWLCWGDGRERPASCLPVKSEGVFFTPNSAEIDLGGDLGDERLGRSCGTCDVVSSLRNLGFGWG